MKKLWMVGIAVAAVLVIWAMHASPLQMAPLLMIPVGLALTTRTSDTSKLQPSMIRKLEFSDDKDGATPVAITFSDEGAAYTTDGDLFNSCFGPRQVNEIHKVDFFLPDMATTNTGTFVNELVTKVIPWFKVTFVNGFTVTVTSGDNTVPAINFKKQIATKDKALGWQLTGVGIKSVEATA